MSAELLDGARFALNQPLALVLAVLLAMWGPRAGRSGPLAAIASFAAGAAAAGLLPPAAWHPLGAAVVLTALGLVAAAGWLPPRAAHLAAMAAGGLAAGMAAALATATPPEAAGSLAVLALVWCGCWLAWQVAAARLLPARPWQLGVRIAGTWAATIGLLLLALQASRATAAG
jgi:hypothetical protein